MRSVRAAATPSISRPAATRPGSSATHCAFPGHAEPPPQPSAAAANRSIDEAVSQRAGHTSDPSSSALCQPQLPRRLPDFSLRCLSALHPSAYCCLVLSQSHSNCHHSALAPLAIQSPPSTANLPQLHHCHPQHPVPATISWCAHPLCPPRPLLLHCFSHLAVFVPLVSSPLLPPLRRRYGRWKDGCLCTQCTARRAAHHPRCQRLGNWRCSCLWRTAGRKKRACCWSLRLLPPYHPGCPLPNGALPNGMGWYHYGR